jgi:hypothetical protein
LDLINSKDNSSIRNAVSEVFKYIIKSPDPKKLNDDEIDLFANWIIETRGKNFINALGYFKKNSIIKSRVKNNEERKIDDNYLYNELFLSRTVDLKGNAPINAIMSKNVRKDTLEYFKLDRLEGEIIDVSDILEHVDDILKSCSYSVETIEDLKEAVKKIHVNNQFNEDVQNKFDEYLNDRFDKVKAANRMK